MQYEVVTLQKKTVVGLKTRTNNLAPDMGQKIGGLWQRLYGGVYERISNKTNGKSIGLYTNYASGDAGDYDVLVGCETTGEEPLEGLERVEIPAGRYARFVVRGDVQQAVAACWAEIWSMDLPRSFTVDFEEYQPEGDMQNTVIHIYVALREEPVSQ